MDIQGFTSNVCTACISRCQLALLVFAYGDMMNAVLCTHASCFIC